jgi:uncharacterized Ntn-hydrolase superfamily protein
MVLLQVRRAGFMRRVIVNTYSIVAYDPAEQAWGVAVASKFLAAGAVVSWARAGVGAVATQALAKVSFGPEGLALMESGLSAGDTLERLLAADSGASHRQVGIVDARGNAAAHTGKDCLAWKGHRTGQRYTCQGNILTGGDTLDAMAEAFEGASGELADRLVAALLAGDRVGGDSRGKQSAAVMVVRPNGGYGGDNDRYLDLRVDDDPDPVNRLAGMLKLHHLFFGASRPEDLLSIDSDIATELQGVLARLGYYTGKIDGIWNEPTRQAFWKFCGTENLEERWSPDKQPDFIDRIVLEFIRERFGTAKG